MGRKAKKKGTSCAKEHGNSPSDSDDSVSRQIRQHHLRLAADRLTNADTFHSELENAHAQFAKLRDQYNKDHKSMFDKYICEQQHRVRESFKETTHQHARLIKMIDAGLGFATDLVEIRGSLCTAEVDLLTQVIRASEISANTRTAVLAATMEDKFAAVLHDWKVSHNFLAEDYNNVVLQCNRLRSRVASLEEQASTQQARPPVSFPNEASDSRGRHGDTQLHRQPSRESSVDSMHECLRRDDIEGAVRYAQKVAELARGPSTPRHDFRNGPIPGARVLSELGGSHETLMLLPQYLVSSNQ